MKKYFIIITVLVFAIFLKFFSSFVFNEIVIKDYKNNKYDSTLVKTLYFLNISEPYIAYYNHGNLLYRQAKYNEAIEKYEKALTKKPKEERICDIRVNLSLSYLKTIDEDNVKETLDILKKAKNILYEDDCASSTDDSGKSQEAEKLEQEIKNFENELNQSSGSDDSNDSNQEEEKNEQESEPKDVEEQLKDLQKESHASRQKDIDYYNESNGSSYYDGKYW